MRYISILILLLGPYNPFFSQSIRLDLQEEGVLFLQGEDRILFYQTANKDLNGRYERSNYIHPLYALDGRSLTEDFPADHLHHRGIFWAWHQLYVGKERIGDGWEIRDLKWEVLSVEELNRKDEGKSIRAQVDWKSPLWLDDRGQEAPLVSEFTTLTVHPASRHYRVVDVEISLLGREPDMRIGGSEDEKGYGGFSARIRLVDGQMIFRGAHGAVKPRLTPVRAGGWMDISGPLGQEGATAGVSIFSHPENPGHPPPWILRESGSMQNAVYPHPGAEAIPLSHIEPTVLRYRLLIHDGLSVSEIASLYQGYRR